jgi:thymidylate synthase (FAD)
LQAWWEAAQSHTIDAALDRYEEALARGIAKEQARALLPEGLTMSRMFMAGNVRSWMHYCQVRTDAGTQKEHREIAEQISAQMAELFPLSWSAFITEAA